MNSITLNPFSSIRFRRWSRAGYAVFNSLGNYITIGNIVVKISDKSLQKSDSISFCFSEMSDSNMNSDEDANLKSEIASSLSEFPLAILSDITSDTIAACDFNTTKYFIHHSG